MKATFLALLATSVALALPGLSLADETPNPALSACKAEYVQLGPAGFVAKYGVTETLGACLAAHGGSATTAPTSTGPEAACKAEYLQLGAAAFVAKYGTGETFGACLKANSVVTTPSGDAAPENGIAARLCELEYKQSGADSFDAKYGAGDAAKRACLLAKAAQARAIVAQCKQDEACVKKALGVGASDVNSPAKPKAKPHADGSTSLAAALCVAEGKALGKDAFQARYGGKDRGIATCVKTALAKASSIVAACKASSAASKDAFRQCVAEGLKKAAG